MSIIPTVLLVLGIFWTASAAETTITSPATADWGDWKGMERCPTGTYAQAFQLKTEEEGEKHDEDDTALNGIRLFCGPPGGPSTHQISSGVGPWGEWGKLFSCPTSMLITGFHLKVHPTQMWGDDTSTNNVRFFCSSGNEDHYMEGDGGTRGQWSSALFCGENKAVCGIQTQVEKWLQNGDNTALNRVRMLCCDFNIN